MKRRTISILLALALPLSSCYDDYVGDYDHTACYFASQKPLRTVIADRDMSIAVGVSIGGRRAASPSDWARFEIDASLLEGTGLELMPASYYTLSDPSRMTVRKSDLPIASVEIRFTDAFYADETSAGTRYALPLRITDSSLDTILEGKETSVVAIRYISTWHGTYYAKGIMTVTDPSGNVVLSDTYIQSDLSRNITRDLSTLSRDAVIRDGLGSLQVGIPSERVRLTFLPDGTLDVGTAPGGCSIEAGSGSWTDTDGTLELTVSYSFTKDGNRYAVSETLTRRQDPLKDLAYEEW